MQHPRRCQQPAAGGSGGSGSGGGSSSGARAALLPPDALMWQLQWSELQIEQPVGRGSFGCVYRARWNETAVAVKVLFSKGEWWDGLACVRGPGGVSALPAV